MPSQLGVVGVSHRTAPVEVRERFSLSEAEAIELIRVLREQHGIEEAALLSTCNRTELYLYPTRDPGLVDRAVNLLADKPSQTITDAEQFIYRERGIDVAGHLFRVTSGLDSMIVGEVEIQGQVRQAYQLTREVPVDPPATGPVLNRLFEMALGVGGTVRSQTPIGRGAASVASVSVALAKKVFGSLKGRRALVLGAGENSTLVVEALAREGVAAAVVANRTVERARVLAEKVGGTAIPLAEMHDHIRQADIVISSTGSPQPVLTREKIRQAFPSGASNPLLIVDIAIPRDVEPSVSEEPNIFLYNIDDLMRIADETLNRRREAMHQAETLIMQQVDAFQAWYRSQEVVPLIRSLRGRAEEIRVAEMERLLHRLGSVPPEERQELEAASRRLLNQMLHMPIVQLKQGIIDGGGSDSFEATSFLSDLERELARQLNTDGDVNE